jgi:2-methylcitrate dehydratase
VRPQNLVEKAASPAHTYDRRYPEEFPCRMTVRRKDRRELQIQITDYEGFHTRPMTWDQVAAKFERLTAPYTDAPLRRDILTAVDELDSIAAADLTALLGRAGMSQRMAA